MKGKLIVQLLDDGSVYEEKPAEGIMKDIRHHKDVWEYLGIEKLN